MRHEREVSRHVDVMISTFWLKAEKDDLDWVAWCCRGCIQGPYAWKPSRRKPNVAHLRKVSEASSLGAWKHPWYSPASRLRWSGQVIQNPGCQAMSGIARHCQVDRFDQVVRESLILLQRCDMHTKVKIARRQEDEKTRRREGRKQRAGGEKPRRWEGRMWEEGNVNAPSFSRLTNFLG